MRSNIQRQLISRFALVGLVASLPFLLNVGPAETQTKSPYDKERLLKVVRLNALSTSDVVHAVEERGVSFEVTPDVEAEFRSAGARPELIDALRKSYRPASASTPSETPTHVNKSGEGTGVPGGPPLTKVEIVTLLQNGVAATRVEHLVEVRGVNFVLNQEATREIIAAGGTRSLIGAISEKSGASSTESTESTGEYSGIGASLEERVIGGQTRIFVGSTVQNSPAARAGLQRGDRVLAINGESTSGKNASDVSRLVRGLSGSSVTLTVERASTGRTENLRITREAVTRAAFPVGPDYDDLTDQAMFAMQTGKGVYSIQLLQQAIRLDSSRPVAYQLLGFAQLYGAFDIVSAEQSMRAAMERGGSAVFYVYHDHDGFFNSKCEGSFFVTNSGVSFKAKDGNHTFEAENASIKEAKINTLMGLRVGAFHVKVVQFGGKEKTYNFAPATKNSAESKLILRLMKAS